jgi:hypothetical protein
MLDIPKFKTDKELFDFLVENKEDLTNQKKSAIKFADGINLGSSLLLPSVNFAMKNVASTQDKTEIKVKVIINTTNILDSHKDVHIPGLWTKSLKENKRLLHVQEHQSNKFDKIIASGEDLKAYTKTYSWKDLGFDVEGETEALVFDSLVKQSRNPYMFDQYLKGYVDNHSVGMRYEKMVMCINHEDYGAEYEAFKKYKEYIINQEAIGKFFWAITEAKAIEGSAVPMGSNPITPTMSIKHHQLQTQQAKKEAVLKWLKS